MNYKQTLHIFYHVLILGIFVVGVESFVPKGRVGHSSILIGTKLYFFGGTISGSSNEVFLNSNEVFYIDVSQSFNIASPPWTELTTRIPFGSSRAGMTLIDINDDPTVYLVGGEMSDPVSGKDKFTSIVYSFNIKTLEWKIPIINGKIPARRREICAVSDNKGKLYVFGGFAGTLTAGQFFNDVVILDTISSIWSPGSTINAPAKRYSYSATILANGAIVYIGGIEFADNAKFSNMVNMNEINRYDTNLDAWSQLTARNTSLIEPRFYHSAVLAPDGNIIIHGGANDNFGGAKPDIAILNTQITPFEWIVPPVSSNIGEIPLLYGHTANLVGNYMIVAFGYIAKPDAISSRSSRIYIMDIRNYTWIDSFDPNNSSSTKTPTQTSTETSAQTLTQTQTQTPPNNSEDNKMKIVAGVLGGALGILSLSAIGYLGYKLYKKYKRRQNKFNIHWFSCQETKHV